MNPDFILALSHVARAERLLTGCRIGGALQQLEPDPATPGRLAATLREAERLIGTAAELLDPRAQRDAEPEKALWR